MKTISKHHPVFSWLESRIKEVEEIRSEYGDEVENTIQARLAWVLKTFRAEAGYNIKRIGEYRAFSEWLTGIPSAIHIPVYYHEIISLAKQWQSIPENATEKQEDKICENWYNFITVKFFQLCKFNKVQ